jgi:hypothetical protein
MNLPDISRRSSVALFIRERDWICFCLFLLIQRGLVGRADWFMRSVLRDMELALVRAIEHSLRSRPIVLLGRA